MVLAVVFWIFALFAYVAFLLQYRDDKKGEVKIKNKHGDVAPRMSVLSGQYSARHTEMRMSTHKLSKELLLIIGVCFTISSIYFLSWNIIFLWLTAGVAAAFIIWQIGKRVKKWLDKSNRKKSRY
ncbi:MAG: hypothetical protein FWB74_07515 [Defluviitaleaceae bacterium]|nr:hypothetical protein [Defluviitaleaceae bacterium]